MPLINLKTIKPAITVLLSVFAIIQSGCSNPFSTPKKREFITFNSITGISYTEIARRTNDGLSFGESGYQLQPEWRLKFLSNDSVSIFSPEKKRFASYLITPGLDSIFNTARVWLRVKRMTKDSLILQVMRVKGDSLYKESLVNMIFCSNDYIKNVLHTDTETLKRPSHKDTLFIRNLVSKANKDYKKAFGARQPVILTSKSPLVKVDLEAPVPDPYDNLNTSDYYLDPIYDITINKAYKDFYYTFTVYVDNMGQMHYNEPTIGFIDDDFKNSYVHLSTAIMESYLKFYLHVQPGSTLGMPHSSIITLKVKGNAADK